MYKTLLDSQSVLDTSGETSIFETFRNPGRGGGPDLGGLLGGYDEDSEEEEAPAGERG